MCASVCMYVCVCPRTCVYACVLMDKTGLLGWGWVDGEPGGGAVRVSRLPESYFCRSSWLFPLSETISLARFVLR